MEQYIPKSVLVAEIESWIKSIEECFNGKFPMSQSVKETEQDKGKLMAYKSILSFLDTLEVKEVDLDKELKEWMRDNTDSADFFDVPSLVKYFFDLGLSINNPITAADRGTSEEIIINLKRVEKDYRIDLTKEITWVRNKAQKGE